MSTCVATPAPAPAPAIDLAVSPGAASSDRAEAMHARVVRVALGLYAAVHCAHLAPWAAEVFSSDGAVPDGRASPLLHAFPNVLALCDAPAFVTALVALGAALGLLLAAGVRDRACAALLWYLGACLLGRNPLIANPALPCVGWLLLAHAVAPRDLASRRTLREVTWAVMAIAYTYGGATKLSSPSWLDGAALARVLECPLARPTALRDALLALPPALLAAATWGALALEGLYAPLALSRRARPLLWLAAVGMHLSLVVLVDFADLSAGTLLMHVATFDPEWFARGRNFAPQGVASLSARPLSSAVAPQPGALSSEASHLHAGANA